MKKMNAAKGLALGLVSLIGITASAQTDTTRRTDTSGKHYDTDTVRPRQDNMKTAWPKQDYKVTDLRTNAPIDVYYDTVNYVVLNAQTRNPVEYYVLNGIDTVHGATGLVVNGLIQRGEEGTFYLDSAKVKIDGDEIKVKYADGRKVKWEKGKMKIKEWGTKAKIKDDKMKMKNEWGRVRWKNGEWIVDKDS